MMYGRRSTLTVGGHQWAVTASSHYQLSNMWDPEPYTRCQWMPLHTPQFMNESVHGVEAAAEGGQVCIILGVMRDLYRGAV